jgi:hypothetical protein
MPSGAGSLLSGPGPDQRRRLPLPATRRAVGSHRPRPMSFPCARAAPRASSRARLTRSIPTNPLRESDGAVVGSDPEISSEFNGCAPPQVVPACRHGFGRRSSSPSRLHRRNAAVVAVVQAYCHPFRIPAARNIVNDCRCHQYLFCRGRCRGQRLTSRGVELGEYVIQQ